MSEPIGPPEDYREIDLRMSNLGYEIDPGLAEALRAEKVFARHAAWNFNGLVWWNGSRFGEQVSRYGVPRATFYEDSLEGLMALVNGRFGPE